MCALIFSSSHFALSIVVSISLLADPSRVDNGKVKNGLTSRKSRPLDATVQRLVEESMTSDKPLGSACLAFISSSFCLTDLAETRAKDMACVVESI